MQTQITETMAGYTSRELTHQTRDYLRAIQKNFQPEDYKMYLGCDIGEQSKYVTVRFDEKQVKKWGHLELLALTDIQFDGVGGARTKGAVAQVLDRFMQWGDSQLYLMGHLHQGMVVPAWREVRDGRGGLRLEKKIAAIGTSFLESWGGYGEVAGFHPHDVMMARAVVEASGKWELTLR